MRFMAGPTQSIDPLLPLKATALPQRENPCIAVVLVTRSRERGTGLEPATSTLGKMGSLIRARAARISIQYQSGTSPVPVLLQLATVALSCLECY